VGRLLSRHASYGIPEYLIGVRSHADQLGFHANRGKRIIGPEKHGTIEIFKIAARINSQERQGPDLNHVEKVLTRSLATNLPNEKIKGTTRIAVSNALGLMARSKVARRDPLLIMSLVLTASTPPRLLDWIRGSAKARVRKRQAVLADWFASELRRQRHVSAERWARLNG
jgi:hypothetical protein